MKLHPNAKTTPHIRALMVRRVLQQAKPVKDTAETFGVSVRTVHKWVRRYRQHGLEGLQDRSSRPQRIPRRTSGSTIKRIEKLRRHRLTAWEISQQLSVPASTVSRWLRRKGMGRLACLEPKPPVRRYERDCPGELLHLDTKKLGKIGKPGHRVHGDRSVRTRRAGLEKIIYSCTGGALYGDPETIPCLDDAPLAPVSPYGMSKWMAEKYLEFCYRQ